jgi:DNA repair protein RecO (recombination protein O)
LGLDDGQGRSTGDLARAVRLSPEAPARGRPPLSERLYRTEAIVLARMNLGEADRILTVFTPHHGKLRVIAKGVRKARSRLGPHLELFTRCQVNLTRGRDLDVVTSAETVDACVTLRDDLDVLGHASHMVEMVARLTEDREEQEAVYDLLRGSLRLLADGVEPFAVTRHFEFALLATLGYRPELYRCLNCDRPLDADTNRFSIVLGGMLGPECRAADPRSVAVSINTQKYLREMDRNGLTNLIRLRVGDETRRELEAVLGAYLRHLTERDLASLQVTREIRRSLGPQTGEAG